MRTRPLHATLIAALAAAVLTACVGAPLPEANMKTPAEAQQITQEMMDDTIAFFGGPEGWTTRNPEPANSCTVEGREGVSYYWIQQGPGTGTVEARDDAATRLVEHLRSEGYTAYIGESNPKDPRLYVYAKDGAVAGFSAYISAEYVNIEAESWCVTGADTPSPSPAPTPTP